VINIIDEIKEREMAIKALQYKGMEDHDLLITATVKIDILTEQNKKSDAETIRWRNAMDDRLDCAETKLTKHDVYFAFLGGFIIIGVPFFVWLIDNLFFR